MSPFKAASPSASCLCPFFDFRNWKRCSLKQKDKNWKCQTLTKLEIFYSMSKIRARAKSCWSFHSNLGSALLLLLRVYYGYKRLKLQLKFKSLFLPIMKKNWGTLWLKIFNNSWLNVNFFSEISPSKTLDLNFLFHWHVFTSKFGVKSGSNWVEEMNIFLLRQRHLLRKSCIFERSKMRKRI